MIRKLAFLLLISTVFQQHAVADYKEVCVKQGDILDSDVSCYYHIKYNKDMDTKCYVRLDIPPRGTISADQSVQLITLGTYNQTGSKGNAVGTSLNTCKSCYPHAMLVQFNNYASSTVLATPTGGLHDYTSNLGIGSLTPAPAGCNNAACAIQYFGPSLCPCAPNKPCARQMGTTCDLCNPPYVPGQ